MDKSADKKLLSVVIYVSNDQYKLTADSLAVQSVTNAEGQPVNSQVQLIIMRGESELDEEYVMRLKEKIGTVVVSDKVYDCEQTAYKESLKYVKGKLLHFAKCGAVYSENVVNAVGAEYSSGNEEVKLLTILCGRSASNSNVSEINGGFKGKYTLVDFNEKSDTPFIFLSNCFISTSLDIMPDTSLKTPEVFESALLLSLVKQTQIMRVIRRGGVSVTPYSGEGYVFDIYEHFRDNKELLESFFYDFIQKTLNDFKSSLGFVPTYLQYNIMRFLRWTFTVPSAEEIFGVIMSVEEYKKYLRPILMDIDDSVINNCGLMMVHKYMIFMIKYDNAPRFIVSPNNKKLFFGNTKLCTMSTNLLAIEFITMTDTTLTIRGRIKYIGCNRDEFNVFALLNGEERVYAKDVHHPYDTIVWGENYYSGISFDIDVDISNKDEIYVELFSVNHDDVIKRTNIRFDKFAPLASGVAYCYYYKGGHILTYDGRKSALCVRKAYGLDRIKAELRYMRSLRRINSDYSRNAIRARLAYFLLKPFYRKSIWLISDRINKGDDNGEAFFKYMQTVKDKNVKCYFVIDKESDEGKRISKLGKTISTGSRKHKMNHLRSSYIISSQGNNPVVNPLMNANIYYRDITCANRFVFLQHGVTKDDISSWLNLYNRNMFGFIVSTNQEYESVFNYDYFYTPERVWLTGMPRNDLLYHDEKKYITIMPTWRKSLMTYPDPVTGIWNIKDDFKESRYYKFYNSLLNDERLIKAAEEYGYTICHKPHPNIEPYVDLFDKNESVYFFEPSKTYREIFAQSDLMLTDYSSVAFDFAYLRKPIVYAQFDKQAFFSGEHSYTEGYFDYERDGFGDVVYDLDSTVNCLIEYMKNGCKPKDKYLQRINDTFAFSDKNCCKRVYEKLAEYDRQKN